jgi:hypothetical protein
MNYPMRKMDMVAMVRATNQANYYIQDLMKKAAKVQSDTDGDCRLAKQECKACFYVYGKIGGAAMTTSACGLCGKPMVFGSTCVDAVCPECAKAHKLCKHCGGDLEMRKGRKKWPTSTVAR